MNAYVPKGPRDDYHIYLAVSGLAVNRWSLARWLKRMPGVIMIDDQIIRNFFRDKPLIIFDYKGKLFMVEPEYFAGEELEIREINAKYTDELFEIQEYLETL